MEEKDNLSAKTQINWLITIYPIPLKKLYNIKLCENLKFTCFDIKYSKMIKNYKKIVKNDTILGQKFKADYVILYPVKRGEIMIDLLYEYNDDNLMLQGTYFDSRKKDICILFIHGQAQSILNNKFAYEFGKYFTFCT